MDNNPAKDTVRTPPVLNQRSNPIHQYLFAQNDNRRQLWQLSQTITIVDKRWTKAVLTFLACLHFSAEELLTLLYPRCRRHSHSPENDTIAYDEKLKNESIHIREVKQMTVYAYGNLCCYTHAYTNHMFILYLVKQVARVRVRVLSDCYISFGFQSRCHQNIWPLWFLSNNIRQIW